MADFGLRKVVLRAETVFGTIRFFRKKIRKKSIRIFVFGVGEKVVMSYVGEKVLCVSLGVFFGTERLIKSQKLLVCIIHGKIYLLM